ncbi:winged helix-turn-helix domain-containing protein [Fundidesulfovibrio putealis]|uniref:winged helix-turn-helix domain-containing protein n=1 Tax=Fundidesulfovibrio putealis TaxID=270496 RepID=UPI000415D978|nr:winged helix-turn-helix domain-containing protein [Fundidesulfovibrio putealis]
MFLVNKTYYRPSKAARYLAILDTLAQDSQVSQNELGRRANLSGAMVNQYLKEMAETNLIEFERVNGKSFRYLLTDEGEARRRTMFSSFSSETVQIYTALKAAIVHKLANLKSRSLVKLVLFGASETCEIVLQALRATGGFEVMALVDNDPAKAGKTLGGYVISPPVVLDSLRPQAVVITSYGCQEEIHGQLRELYGQHNVEIIRL